ncbi:hypothetical protein NEOC65_000995 [Neochlamydia sp. AcF65]|nr:hypothetical protein [Neochlamydia sp. AcF65]
MGYANLSYANIKNVLNTLSLLIRVVTFFTCSLKSNS